MNYAIFVPCGPKPFELVRLRDLLEAMQRWEPDCPLILIANDGNPDLSIEALKSSAPECRIPIEIFDAPRQGRGWGWAGGLVLSELRAMRLVNERMADLKFLLKMDTDALPIGPFATDLAASFQDVDLGILGSRVIDEVLPPERRTPPVGYFRTKIAKLKAPISLWRKPTWHLRSTLTSRETRRIAEIIRTAITRGYTPGELMEGGALAFSGDYVRRVVDANLDREESTILHLNVSDDLFLSPLAYYLGLRCKNSELFCIDGFALRYQPSNLRERCPSARIVHPIKTFIADSEVDSRKEEEMRAVFRQLRTTE